MKSRRKAHVIEHLGVQASGETRTQAKQNAEELVRSFVADDLTPHLVSNPKYPGTFAVVVRTSPYAGWGYALEYPGADRAGDREFWPNAVGTGDNRRQAIRAARLHLAQVVMDIHDDNRSGIEFCQTPEERKEHLQYLSWQRSYAALVKSGKSDTEARQLIGSSLAPVASLLTPDERERYLRAVALLPDRS